MPRKKVIPKIKYIQVKNPDLKAVDQAFDYLFEKVLEQESSKQAKKTAK